MFNRLIGMDKKFHDRFKDSYTTNVIEFEILNILVMNGLLLINLIIIMYLLRFYSM
jgi:hypothetical protein